MINFNISQMGALILNENCKLSSLLKSQISAAPSKADIWHLRCEINELVGLRRELAKRVESNTGCSSLALVQEEVEEICKKYT